MAFRWNCVEWVLNGNFCWYNKKVEHQLFPSNDSMLWSDFCAHYYKYSYLVRNCTKFGNCDQLIDKSSFRAFQHVDDSSISNVFCVKHMIREIKWSVSAKNIVSPMRQHIKRNVSILFGTRHDKRDPSFVDNDFNKHAVRESVHFLLTYFNRGICNSMIE